MTAHEKRFLLNLIALAALCMAPVAAAQDDGRVRETSVFELRDGDRVVLLGDALIEAAQEHGYVEGALTTRWPGRDVTFRNVGWAGDTVYGTAREDFTNPPSAYERLLDQVAAAQPSVLFVGYGANVAFEGADGLAPFTEGLNRLLDDLEDATAARIVLLSPTPHEADASPVPADTVRRYNETLRRVTDAIAEIAREGGHRFVDLFSGLRDLERQTDVPLTTNGVHLSDAGYYHMAMLVEDGLGLPPRRWSVEVDVAADEVSAEGATVTDVRLNQDGGNLTVKPDYLPVSPPTSMDSAGTPDVRRQALAVKGLEPGRFRLATEGETVSTASGVEWSDGVALRGGPAAEQAEKLRRLIVAKNRLYFLQYRPPNETYLLGFRAYEQGQHAEELAQYDVLIAAKEHLIRRLRTPTARTYTLAPLSE